MAIADQFDFNRPDLLDEEDETTLAAIERAIQGVKEGRVVPAEEVRERMEQWLSKSSTPKIR
jgi:predicted transcriptional regulator